MPSAMEAHCYISFLSSNGLLDQVKLVLLDHDLQYGDGAEFLANTGDLLKASGVPVLTASGQHQNNERLMANGADHYAIKDDIINGAHDELIYKLVGDFTSCPEDWRAYTEDLSCR